MGIELIYVEGSSTIIGLYLSLRMIESFCVWVRGLSVQLTLGEPAL
jgi:hypothetical protein